MCILAVLAILQRARRGSRARIARARRAPTAQLAHTLPTDAPKKREDVRKLCGAASRARPKGERWLEEPYPD